MTHAAWEQESYSAAPASRGGWSRAPRYAPADFVTLLWRERFLMAGVFLVIAVIGVVMALSMKTLYSAESSLLVRLGQEYVYQPEVGDAARGTAPEADAVVQSEVEILSSDQLKQRVIERIGPAKLYPGFARGYDQAAPDQKREIMGKALDAMDRSLKIVSAPGTPVVRLSYAHPDPQLAAQVLNTLLDEYLIYRHSVLLDAAAPLEAQRKAFEARLAQADEAYENFLGSNNIGDFESEKTSLAQLQASLQQQKFTNDAQLQDREGRLDALNAQVSQIAPEIGLYRDVDHAAQDKLTDLRLQREALLTRYKPDATPVHDLDVQIAGIERAMGQGSVQNDGVRRVGVNPVYQTVLTDRIQMTAEVAALKQASDALGKQIDEVTERQLRLAQLEPQYDGLARDRDVLQSNVRDFTVKEQETQAADAISQQSNDNISVIERAIAPTQGKSLKKPALALSLLFAAFAALCAGLLRAFTRPGFPTAESAGRTLDLPVLAKAGVKDR